MDNRNHDMDPWDRDCYETGSTNPPKNRGGLIAVLLIAVIFLGGIASALGLLNVKLFAELNTQNTPTTPVKFYDSESTVPTITTPDPTERVDVTFPGQDVTVELQDTPEAVENIPQSGGLSLQEIYNRNIDSVVSITCTLSSGTSSGTGVVLSSNGYLVTNCHVIEGAGHISVLFTDGRTLTASLVGADPVSDLAVLYVPAEDLKAAQFGSSDSLRVGDSVAAIGDPLGVELRGTMTNGIISAINRDVTVSGRTMSLIQTNAALNSGNSGGPLLNCYGQVIGINTMKISSFAEGANVEGLGFAIPSTTVKEIVDQLISQGYVSGRPDLGIIGESVSVYYQHFYHMPEGLFITAVDADSAAAEQGIAEGDILISLDGTRIYDNDDLNGVLYSLEVGDSVEAVIYRHRDRRQYTVNLILGEAKG